MCSDNCLAVLQFLRDARTNFKVNICFPNFLEETMKLNVPVSCKAGNSDAGHGEMSANTPMETFSESGGINVSNDPLVPGNPSCEFHYVPLLETLKNYLQQPDVWASCQ